MNNIIERTKDRECEITKRLASLHCSDQVIETALYSWDNWTEHYNWCMTASKEEIENWANTILTDTNS